ncbi:MAG: hypothetical protein ABFS19_12405 [Thermodesulfobacteriota bacterium]
MMRRILSTCNFKPHCSALLIAVLLVGTTEIILSSKIPAQYFSHEVDRTLHKIKTKPMKADYILIGDSVGRQLLQRYGKDKRFAMLATNQAIEMTGQYFMVKRYLENNPPPKAVIFSGLPLFIDQNLEQRYTENYVLRTFNNFDESFELLIAKKNLVQAAKAVSYKLFPSFKYRLHLQKEILGTTNASIYTGVRKKTGKNRSQNYSAGTIVKKLQSKYVSRYHLYKLTELLTTKGIHFYYIPVPIRNVKKVKNRYVRRYKTHFRLLSEWKNEGINITYFKHITEYPNSMFRDSVHLNKEGLANARPSFHTIIKKIVYNPNQ